MARTTNLDGSQTGQLSTALARSFQSGHINFLIGSGASQPAIPIAGAIEQEIAHLATEGKHAEGRLKLYQFLAAIQEVMNKLIRDEPHAPNTTTLAHYQSFLQIVETILSERRTSLIPKQATIFTTNYDLFLEKAALSYPALKLNDGFSRVPSLVNRMEYSSRTFFDMTYNTGPLYNYKVEIPSINLVKLHGSFSWQRDAEEIVFNVATKALLTDLTQEKEMADFTDSYVVVLPQTAKFRATLIERTYYELLRLYANELDRENSLLIAFGFSFGDEHILSITKRALKNPTLRLMIFAFDDKAVGTYQATFGGHNNVDILAPKAGERLDFATFNQIVRTAVPKAQG